MAKAVVNTEIQEQVVKNTIITGIQVTLTPRQAQLLRAMACYMEEFDGVPGQIDEVMNPYVIDFYYKPPYSSTHYGEEKWGMPVIIPTGLQSDEEATKLIYG